MYIFRPGFARRVLEIVERNGVSTKQLEIEITESVIFDRSLELFAIIQELRSYGFRISMDDFGSGYSSLNVLKEIPVDILKLDGAFFDKEGDPRGNDVVETAIELARKLGMKTVAEGVETFTQVEFLRNADCDMVQGYVFSKPLSIENFEVLAFSARKAKTDTNSEYNRTGKTSNE
jgi:EAL domain-containing protein (putative c-di-GMP-specific phosphodiesterase class I)